MLSRLGVPRLGRSHLYHGRLVSVRCQFGWPSFCQAVDVLVDRAEARCALTTYAALAMAERSRGGGRVRQVEAEGLVVDLDVQPIAGPGRLHRAGCRPGPPSSSTCGTTTSRAEATWSRSTSATSAASWATAGAADCIATVRGAGYRFEPAEPPEQRRGGPPAGPTQGH